MPYEDLCATSRNRGRGQVIISNRYCRVYLLVRALDTYFWHTCPDIDVNKFSLRDKKCFIIGSGYGLSLGRRATITRPNVGLWTLVPLGMISVKCKSNYKTFYQEIYQGNKFRLQNIDPFLSVSLWQAAYFLNYIPASEKWAFGLWYRFDDNYGIPNDYNDFYNSGFVLYCCWWWLFQETYSLPISTRK